MLPAASFHVDDLRRRRPGSRRAVAVGELRTGVELCAAIIERRLAQGDAFALAEIAGVQGARQTMMPLRQSLALDVVTIRCAPTPAHDAIRIYCEVAAEARRGVGTEAVAGVNAALLAMLDLLRDDDPALALGGVRVLLEEGGERGPWLHPDGLDAAEREAFRPHAPARIEGWPAAVLTLSDRASRGEYDDRSGPVLVAALQSLGANLVACEVLGDELAPLVARLRALAAAGTALVLTTGGTGLGPRDITPEALAQVATRRVPGLAELFRAESRHHTPLAWLSRADAVLVDRMLVIALPGSPRAVAQGMAILAPLLGHARAMIDGGAHP